MAYTISPEESLRIRYPEIYGGAPAEGTAPAVQPTAPSGYSLTPAPTQGRGAFGSVPGQVGIPDVASQLQEQLPDVSQINQEASKDVLSQLRGELNPDTVKAIQDASAEWGVQSGMPGSGLALNRGLRDIGLSAEALQQQGIGNYQTLAETVRNTQTVSPETQIQTALQNAINAASPDPASAAAYSQALFNQQIEATNPTKTVTVDYWDNGVRKSKQVQVPA